jgi:hypothetical protein
MSKLKVVTKESLFAENALLKQKLADINKYAYESHCAGKDQHSALYKITTMAKGD